jgi:hypothetical protein
MQVDETGRYDMTRGIDHNIALEWKFADGHDLVAFDGNIPNGIKPGLWVNHPTAHNHNIIGKRDHG